MASLKRKVNLTIDEGVLEKAKRLVDVRGASLSSLVEDFLARLVLESDQTEGDWLSRFHERYRLDDEPSDEALFALREKIGEKYL